MKIFKRTLLTILLAASMTNLANAQGLNDLLNILRGNSGTQSSQSATNNSNSNQSSQSQSTSKGSGLGNTLTNLLEGVFSSSNITADDLCGVWTSNGPAVCFQSDGFLQKAGGIAAASVVENKLAPYYEQYGLNGAVITINTDRTFTMKTKMLTLRGTIEQSANQKGVFEFTFTALGSFKLGSVTTYVEKTSNTMRLMFDATKLKNLVSMVAKYTGINLAKTLGTILDSYEGLCVGFRLEKTGTVPGDKTTGFGTWPRPGSGSTSNSSNSGKNPSTSNSGTGNDSTGTGFDQLLNILGIGR